MNILAFTLKPIFFVEKLIYIIRNLFWEIPDYIFRPNRARDSLIALYKSLLPFSHFALSSLVFLSLLVLFWGNNFSKITGRAKDTLFEGVVMGVDSFGFTQKINKVDPFAPVNVQLEKDLLELIYEPLIKLEFTERGDGTWGESIRKILASEVFEIRSGADYRFDLKQNVYWHDGKKFTADDVIRTFEIVSNLSRANNSYSLALKQLQWEKIDDYSVRVCTKGVQELNNCSNTRDNPILSNFLELISVKITPAHLTQNLNPDNYDLIIHPILVSPVGTGKFKFFSSDDSGLSLNINELYHQRDFVVSSKIRVIRFKYFSSFEDARLALISGNIHTLLANTTEFSTEIKKYPHITKNLSPVLYTQYWGLYFNLKKDENGDPISKTFFQNKKVRQAISSAINRDEVITVALENLGEEAFGPINKNSTFFNKDADWFTFDRSKAITLLEEEGWKIPKGQKYRVNEDGDILEFNLYFLNSFDRKNIARIIKDNLSEIGVKANITRDSKSDIEGWDLDELTNQVLIPKTFDILLFGMNTFIDPDRYELFHSSQSEYPGLNLSGYVSTDLSVVPNPNRQSKDDKSLIQVPKVDKLLDQARRFDPKASIDKRKIDYQEVQQLIAKDAPVVFLYHPKFLYYSNTILQDLTLKNVSSQEDRFRSIDVWKIN